MRQQLATREHFRRGNAILTLIVARHVFQQGAPAWRWQHVPRASAVWIPSGVMRVRVTLRGRPFCFVVCSQPATIG
jgi:hypothetical protein